MKYCCLGLFRKEYLRLVINGANRKKWTEILILFGSKNKKHLRGSTQATIHPLAIMLTGLGQYNSLGEYCGPHTASSVFLILVL